MTLQISRPLLGELAEFVNTRMGLSFPENRWKDLEKGMTSAAHEFGSEDVEECIRWLTSAKLTKQDFEILVSHLTIGETYFFRDKRMFEALEKSILPKIINSRRNEVRSLRIWSAGCATGEEPYTVAILIRTLIPDISDWNITILATDINPNFLKKAREGVYDMWSFRDAPDWIMKYFKKTRNGYEINKEIKKMVLFSYHNLAEDAYPSLFNNTSAMDIIFCRNVLMYFSHERAKKVVSGLYNCLVDGGWLTVSAVETSNLLFSQYAPVKFPNAIFYRKDIQPVIKYIPQPLSGKIRQQAQKVKIPEKKLSVPPSAPQKKSKPLYKEALEFFKNGNYEKAVEKLVQKIKVDPDIKTMNLLARAYANYGRSIEAQEWCEKVISINRLDPESHYLYAMILQERGQYENAIKELKKSLYLDHDFVLAHFGLGNLYRQQGRINDSDRHFENALIILRRLKRDDILPGSDGITAGRLSEIINSIKK